MIQIDIKERRKVNDPIVISRAGVTAMVALLQSASIFKASNPEGRAALEEVEEFADTLSLMLERYPDHADLVDALGL